MSKKSYSDYPKSTLYPEAPLTPKQEKNRVCAGEEVFVYPVYKDGNQLSYLYRTDDNRHFDIRDVLGDKWDSVLDSYTPDMECEQTMSRGSSFYWLCPKCKIRMVADMPEINTILSPTSA